jgi:threonine aldolase
MNFRSDNNAGVAPEILQALVSEAGRQDDSYGRDRQTASLNQAWSEVFEIQVQVIPVVSGTAANSLALSLLSPPHGRVFCHADAHVLVDEANAPGFFQPGLALSPLPGKDGKIEPDALRRALDSAPWGSINCSQPAALSLTQATEWGAVYDLDHLETLARTARDRDLFVHMDGARLANAIVRLNCTPAEATWRRGIDVLSLGATKNGCLLAEAVIVFGDRPVSHLWYKAKQAGHVASKLRFLSAQLLAYAKDGLWLELASRANRAAAMLASELSRIEEVALACEPQANMVFARLGPELSDRLRRRGVAFHAWDAVGTARFVTSFETDAATVGDLAATIRSCVAEPGS